MTIDKDQFVNRERSPINRKSVNQSMLHNLQLLKRESVRCGALVGSQEWDSFTGYIESILKSNSEIKELARKTLEDPKVVAYEHLVQVKMTLRESLAIEGVLEQLVRLPYLIMHESAAADDTVSKIPLPSMPEFLKNVN